MKKVKLKILKRQETVGVLKNSYERHCERQSLEAISARLRRVISNLLRLLRSAGGGPRRTPRKDNRRHFFNSPADPIFPPVKT